MKHKYTSEDDSYFRQCLSELLAHPAIERLKSHLSGGIKSDEEIAKGRSLKKVTYKDILLDDDFEEIDFRKGTGQEKDS